MDGLTPGGGPLRVLFVTSAGAPEAVEVLRDLELLEPPIELTTAIGAAAALEQLRTWTGYGVVFLGPGLPHNESLALIASLRRDHTPVAIVPVITDAEPQFFAPAISAGADDVVIWRDGHLIEIADTLRRVRHSRHLDPGIDGPRLRVLYAGQDAFVRDMLESIPFVHVAPGKCTQDGALSLVMAEGAAAGDRADILVVDEQCGDAHMLQVLKWVKARVPEMPVVVLTPPTAGELGGAALDLGADDSVSKAGTYRRRFVAVLYRLLVRRDAASSQPLPLAAAAPATAPAPAPVPAWVNELGERDELKQALEDADTELTELRSELNSVTEELAQVRAALDEARAELDRVQAQGALGQAEIAAAVARATAAEHAHDALRQQLATREDEVGVARRDAGQAQAALSAELDQTRTRLAAATAEIATLKREQASLTESQGFDKALRDRDREEIATLHRDLAEARERLAVLEQTLRRTEDDAAERLAVIERERAAERREFEGQLADAADRLHAVATTTQDMQVQLERQFSAAREGRDRLSETGVFGHAVFSDDGELLRCSDAFATMFGYGSATEALTATAGDPFPGTIDHALVRDALASGRRVDREESTVRQEDGRPFRVLMAAVRSEREGGEPIIERLFVDLRDRAALEAELRMARRLESAGRLAAEMRTDVERGLSAFESGTGSGEDRARTLAYIRQLLAYGRRQARPAGYLSLNDAIRRAEPRLRALAGEGVDLQLSLGDIEHVAAGEDDVDQLLADLVITLAGCLPYGGSLVLATAPVTSGFVLSTQLSATAAGYGVLAVRTTASLTRHASRCAGVVRLDDDSPHASALHVILPS